MKILQVGTFLVILAPGCFGQCTGIPLSYCGRTDQDVASGAAPTLGAAGTTTTDPDFGSKVLRVTQSGYNGDPAGLDYVPQIGYAPIFAPDDTYMLVYALNGQRWVVPLNPNTTPISTNGSPINANTGPSNGWYTVIGFSAQSDILYGLSSDFHSIVSWDLNPAHASVTIHDMTTIPGFAIVAKYGTEQFYDHLDALFCVTSDTQDGAYELGCYNKATGHTYAVNLAVATVQTDSNAPVAMDNLTAAQLNGCGIHNVEMSYDGTWALFGFNQCTAYPNYTTTGQFWWQVGTNHVVIDINETGHSVVGYGPNTISKSSSTCGSGGYDGRGWLYRIATNTGTFASPHAVLMPGCVSATSDAYLDSHESWFGNKNDGNVNAYPVMLWLITGSGNTGAYMEWEIDALQTSAALTQFNAANWGANVTSTIWRLAHTFNDSTNQQCPEIAYATLGESADGKYISFASDWEGTTGTGNCTNHRRIDVFIVDARTASLAGTTHSSRAKAFLNNGAVLH